MRAVRKVFASVDVCPSCKGAFLDRGEGVATAGQAVEASFLVDDGAAKRRGVGELLCPAEHAETKMIVYVVGDGEDAIEIDVCPLCSGFFLDDGETEALNALDDGIPTTEVVTDSGARFSAPPALDRQEAALDAVRAERGKDGTSLFAAFAADFLKVLARPRTRRHRRERRERHD